MIDKTSSSDTADRSMRSILTLLSLMICIPAAAQSVTLQQAYQGMQPRVSDSPTTSTAASQKPPSGLSGRVVCGYQGWFRAPGDGTGLGFHHYTRKGKFEPGFCTIDLWPDLSEFTSDEKFPTPFKHADGSTAHVFSSVHPDTVDRHFRWMKDYHIDGVFVQRFATLAAKPRRSYDLLKADNRKLQLCRDAANEHDRVYALMYDLSGISDEHIEPLIHDWKKLRTKMQLGTDPNDHAYLHINGKPLIAVWGIGFSDDRKYSLKSTEQLLRLLKHNPEWGGFSLMLGVPYHWRSGKRDATSDPHFREILKLADIISPWSPGRYRTTEEVDRTVSSQMVADTQWCKTNGIEYLPVLFPGFSWRNMHIDDPKRKSDGISRDGGKFLWSQFRAAKAAGLNSAYIAMFDEIDEATAIFKCTNNPPVGASTFKTYDGLPSDHYLWLTQEGKRLLNGDIPTRGKEVIAR